MKAKIVVRGMGYALGSAVLSNAATATSLGFTESWFERHTGIIERRGCLPGETVVSLAAQAVTNALRDAGLDAAALGGETVLLHIQNGFTHLTPPPAVLLCKAAGMWRVRPLGLDGVCSEAINAIEIAALMVTQGTCERCIVCAAVDFLPLIDPQDTETAGLFGAGAGAIVLERANSGESGILGLCWVSDNRYWALGIIPVLGHVQRADGVDVRFGYYRMNGSGLAKVALQTLPHVVESVLDEAGWALTDVDRFVTHQPNAKLLGIGLRRLGIPRDRVEIPVVKTGNLGPASLFVALGLANEAGRIAPGNKILLLSFGLGFSCSGAALVV